MNSRLTSILLSTLMILFLASYSIYTGVRYFYSPYQTETAFSYTVSDSYRTRAVAIRNESLLLQQANEQGVLNYTKQDGAVVVPGSVIAQVFADSSQLRCQMQMEQFESEIELLKNAQSTSEQYLGSDILGAQVNDAVGSIVDAAARNDFEDIYNTRDKIQLLLGKYRISTGRDNNYSDRISYLVEEQKHFSSQLSQTYKNITTNNGGYFCSTVDGYETLLTTDFGALSATDYQRAINGTLKPQKTDAIGKVQVGHDWYMALVVSKDDVPRFCEGAAVFLYFNIENCNNIPASVYRVIQDENGDAVVIIKTNYINDTLIDIRQTNVEICFKAYTGLRVSIQALRYEGQTEGVYVKNGNLIAFKAIDRIYTGENFVLCTSAVRNDEEAKSYEPLDQFDEVIIKGIDIYDGKII